METESITWERKITPSQAWHVKSGLSRLLTSTTHRQWCFPNFKTLKITVAMLVARCLMVRGATHRTKLFAGSIVIYPCA